MTAEDANPGLLQSELEWLDGCLEEVFAPDFEEEADFLFPFQWGGARSRTIVLLSEQAADALARLVLGLQEVLCRAQRDWILYLQGDGAGDDFVVWVYPDKIWVTEEHENTVRELLRVR